MSQMKFFLFLVPLLLLGALGLTALTENLSLGIAAALGCAAICLAVVRVYPAWVITMLIGCASGWISQSGHILSSFSIGIGLLGALCFSIYYRADLLTGRTS